MGSTMYPLRFDQRRFYEVADHFDYHLQTARRRLKALEQEGEVKMKDVEKRFVWWISER